MKLHTATAEVHSGGLGDSRSFDFKIQMNAKAFAVTIDKLYMDKVKASVREYSCNAVDANPPGVPILVHMPSMYEPYWSVSDEGTGLAPDQMEDIFCVLFKSTKDDRNDQIGALGLGCKAGFAYTDQFTVESRHAGRKITYTASRASGIPTMVQLLDLPLEEGEKTGLTITIPVKTHDLHLWEMAAQQVYSYFKTPPRFTHKPVTLEERGEPLAEGKFWRYYAKKYHSNIFPDRAVAIMGQIAYPIDHSTLAPHLGRVEQILLSMPLEIDVAMGEVDIQPSREGLSYDKETIETLKLRLKLITKDLADALMTPFRSYKTEWEKAANYYRLVENLDYQVRQLIQTELSRLAPNGSSLKLDVKKTIGDGKYWVSQPSSTRYGKANWTQPGISSSLQTKTDWSLDLTKEIYFLIVDKVSRYTEKLMHFYDGKRVVCILPDPNVPIDPKYWGEAPADRFAKASELELPVKASTGPNHRNPTRKVISFTDWGRIGDEVSHQFEDGGVYFKRFAGNIGGPDGVPHPYLAENLLEKFFLNKTLDHRKTFAINKAYWDYLDPADGWVCGWSLVKDKIEKSDWLEHEVKTQALQEITTKLDTGKDGNFLRALRKLPATKTFGKPIEDLRTALAVLTTDPANDSPGPWVLLMAQQLGITLPKPPQVSVTSLRTMIKEALQEYPLLDILISNVYHGTVSDLLSGRNAQSKALFDYLT